MAEIRFPSLLKIKPKYYWPIAGLLVPIFLETFLFISEYFGIEIPIGPVAFILWPSSIFLFADDPPGILFSISMVTVSVAINVALYAAIGEIIKFLILIYRQRK